MKIKKTRINCSIFSPHHITETLIFLYYKIQIILQKKKNNIQLLNIKCLFRITLDEDHLGACGNILLYWPDNNY